MPWRRRAARVAVNLHELRGQPANFAFLPPCRHNLDGTAFTAVTKRYALTGQIKTGYEVRSSRRCPVPGVCPRASTHRTHARGFPRSTDLRCNQTRASTGSTVSPRSREAGRRPSSSFELRQLGSARGVPEMPTMACVPTPQNPAKTSPVQYWRSRPHSFSLSQAVFAGIQAAELHRRRHRGYLVF